ncbi:MAG: hypothetical protein IPK87_13490 [Planctomycetes bacterium]|nr:hypothetical protein [Planctomycetota bacterium]
MRNQAGALILILAAAACGSADDRSNLTGANAGNPSNSSVEPTPPKSDAAPKPDLTVSGPVSGSDGWSLTLNTEQAKRLVGLVTESSWQPGDANRFVFPDYYAEFVGADKQESVLYVYMPSKADRSAGSASFGAWEATRTVLLDGPALTAITTFFTDLRSKSPLGNDPVDEHAVLSRGDVLTFQNKHGTMSIAADSNRKRTYTWDGASRSVFMRSRTKPWQGALGLYWPGPGDHWEEHEGVTRGVLNEERRDFASEADFRTWIKQQQEWYDAQYTPDGTVGGWSINLSRNQLNVELWQITIGGERPNELAGGSTSWLSWTHGDD